MIDKSFVEAIQVDARTEKIPYGAEREVFTKPVFNAPLPVEPRTTALAVATLTGLVDFCASQEDGKVLHVRSYHEVALLSDIQGVARHRESFIEANCDAPLFKFGAFMPHAEFMIGIQALFQDYGDRAKVMQILGTIKDEAAKISTDDGITQRVTASTGVALVAEVKLPNPVLLKPFRTFTEIEQPPSSFVLRVKEGNQVALFEADGGRWKHEAILLIRDYLVENTIGLVIVA